MSQQLKRKEATSPGQPMPLWTLNGYNWLCSTEQAGTAKKKMQTKRTLAIFISNKLRIHFAASKMTFLQNRKIKRCPE